MKGSLLVWSIGGDQLGFAKGRDLESLPDTGPLRFLRDRSGCRTASRALGVRRFVPKDGAGFDLRFTQSLRFRGDMPILSAEPAVFPDDLLLPTDEPALDQRRWYVMHTRPQQEKCLVRELRLAGVPHYLPLIPQRRRIRKRVVHSHLPLFPGYVPVLADVDERITSLTTGRVVHTLEVSDQTGFWGDLRRIEQLLASNVPITPEARLAPGDRVKIRSGALAGLEGRVVRTENSRRFVVTVDFLQRGASVIADDFDLEVIG